MEHEHYRLRLQGLEQDLVARIEREMQHGRDQLIDVAADSGDVSVAHEQAAAEYSGAETNLAMLGHVREALNRIDAGTFGRCIVDDAPIETARLDAVPWTLHCMKHQGALEASAPPGRTR